MSRLVLQDNFFRDLAKYEERFSRLERTASTPDSSRQPASIELSGLAALATDGVVARTGPGAYTTRALGTSDTVTFGTVFTGSAGNAAGGGGSAGTQIHSAGLVRAVRNSDTGVLFAGSVAGDTHERVYLYPGGATRQSSINFGPGNAAPDTFLVRTAAAQLTLSSGRLIAVTLEMTQAGGGAIIRSPNATRWVVRVSDAGALSAVTAASLGL